MLCARDCVYYTGLICLLLITKFKIRKFYVDMRAWYKCNAGLLCVWPQLKQYVCMQICNRDPIRFSCILCLEDIFLFVPLCRDFFFRRLGRWYWLKGNIRKIGSAIGFRLGNIQKLFMSWVISCFHFSSLISKVISI